MPVEDGLALLLHLELPALLGVLHLVQHIGAAPRAGQHIVGVGERLVVLEGQKSTVTPQNSSCKASVSLELVLPFFKVPTSWSVTFTKQVFELL